MSSHRLFESDVVLGSSLTVAIPRGNFQGFESDVVLGSSLTLSPFVISNSCLRVMLF